MVPAGSCCFNLPLCYHRQTASIECVSCGTYYATADLREEINTDLERLYIDGTASEEHFQDAARRQRMLHALVVWGRTHPAISYRQGMHELLAIIVLALEAEAALLPRELDAARAPADAPLRALFRRH